MGDPLFIWDGAQWVPLGGGAGYMGPWSDAIAYPAGALVTHGKGLATHDTGLWGTIGGTAAGEEPGVESISIATTMPIGSNNIETASVITAVNTRCAQFSNVGYTMQTGEPHPWNIPGVYRTAWWVFTPTSTVSVRIDTTASPWVTDTVIGLYTAPSPSATFAQLTEVAADDESGGNNGTSAILRTLTGGQTYFIQVGLYGGDTDEEYVLTVAQTPSAPYSGPWHYLEQMITGQGRWDFAGEHKVPHNTFDPSWVGKIWTINNEPYDKYADDSIGIANVDANGFNHFIELDQIFWGDTIFTWTLEEGYIPVTADRWRDIITGNETFATHTVLNCHPYTLYQARIGQPVFVQITHSSIGEARYLYTADRLAPLAQIGLCGTNGNNVINSDPATGTELWFSSVDTHGDPTAAWLNHARPGDYITFGPTRWQITGAYSQVVVPVTGFFYYKIPATPVHSKPSGSFYHFGVDPVVIPKMW